MNANLLSSAETTETSNSSSTNASVASAPFLQWVLANGATVTPMGDVGGLEGWLVSKKPYQQTIYITPDGKHAVMGIMAAIGGEDITGLQLTAVTLGHAPVITKDDPSGTGHPDASVPPAGAADNSSIAKSAPPAAAAAPEAQSAASATVGDLVVAKPDMHELSVTPAELAKAINNTAVFTVGAPGKPDLIMIADPNCPYCHASWSLLGPLVQDDKIDLTVVLVDVLNGSKQKALDLLANPNIGGAWLAGQGSAEGVPVAAPGQTANMSTAAYYLGHNEAFAQAVKLSGTPTLLWVSRKDGGSPYKVFRGTGLAGVGGFLTALQDAQVATIN